MKKLLVCVVLVLVCSGCITKTIYVAQRYPVIAKPERPTLVNVSGTEMKKLPGEVQQAISGNFGSLMTYSEKLEVGVDEYNKFAVEQNKKSGYDF